MDPNPAKSKSKCNYFTGRARIVILPDPFHLFGEELYWVDSAKHTKQGLREHSLLTEQHISEKPSELHTLISH